MIIECVASTPATDVSGESLDIAGADITPLLEKRGFANSDHRNDFAHVVGRVIDAKKIFCAEDATTPTQLKYWQDLQKPFIWAKTELFDGVGHKEADSIASVYKFYMNKNEAPPVKISVEGKTLERDGKKLKRTLIKGIAITLQPCNRETRSEVTEIRKSLGLKSGSLAKNEDTIPCFVEMVETPLEKMLSLAKSAKQMLSEIRAGSQDTNMELKSAALLKQLKQMTAPFKK